MTVYNKLYKFSKRTTSKDFRAARICKVNVNVKKEEVSLEKLLCKKQGKHINELHACF